jgi:hypothetical protein
MIALSAVAAGLEDALHRWVGGIDGTEPVLTRYQSTRQLIGRLECDGNGRYAIYYDFLDGRPLSFSTDSDATPYVPSPITGCPATPGWRGIEKSLRPALLWAALHLAAPDDQGAHHAVLVSITQKIADVAKDFLQLLEIEWRDRILPVVLRGSENSSEESLWQQTVAVCADYFGTSSFEYRLLQFGIVVHHSSVPKMLGRLLIDVVQAGLANVVLATSTLSEGVNIPVETILVPSLLRFGRTMQASEFRNLAGRAGRPGVATEGQTLVLLHAATSDTATDRYRALQRALLVSVQPEQPRSPIVAAIQDIWSEWRRRNGASDEGAFFQWLETTPPANEAESQYGSLDSLDSVLLPGIVEYEDIRGLLDWEATLQELWSGAFNAHKAEEFERLAFVHRGRGIPTIYPDRGIRRQLYRTGLPPSTALEMLAKIGDIRAVLELGQPYGIWSADQRIDFIISAISSVGQIHRFRGDENPTVWQGQLRWWMQAPNAPQPNDNEIAKWHANVSKWFMYRFCWGIGSVIGLSFDALHDGRVEATSLDQWEQTGLPWAVFWLKELLSWGTLDPAAAFLLGRGLAQSRSDANNAASSYYESAFATSVADSVDPRAIRDWAEATFGRFTIPQLARVSRRHRVEIVDDAVARLGRQLSVLPTKDSDDLTWVDAAGFVVARTRNMPWVWDDNDVRGLDFRLVPDEQIVTEQPYL